MKLNTDYILEKFQKELPSEYAMYLEKGNDSLESLSVRALEYVVAFEKNAEREAEMSSVQNRPNTPEESVQALRDHPIKGRIATGLLAAGRWTPGLGETAAVGLDSLINNKGYDQAKREQVAATDAAYEAYPGTYVGSALGSGLGSASIPKALGRTVGSLNKASGLAGKNMNPFVSAAIEGATVMPEGDNELRDRLLGAAAAPIASKVIGEGINYAARKIPEGFLAAQRTAGKYLRDIPQDISKRVQKSPELLDVLALPPNEIGINVTRAIEKYKDDIVKKINKTLEKAQKGGKRVDVDNLVRTIENDIDVLKFHNNGGEISVETARLIEQLENVIKTHLSPKPKEIHRLTIPEQILETGANVADDVDPRSVPHVFYPEKAYDVPKGTDDAVASFIPQEPYVDVAPKLGQGIEGTLKAAAKSEQDLALREYLKKYSGMADQSMRKGVRGLGRVSNSPVIRSRSTLPYDLWNRIDGSLESVSTKLFGEAAIPKAISDDVALKVVDTLAGDAGVVSQLGRFIPEDQLNALVSHARAIQAQNAFSGITNHTGKRVGTITIPTLFMGRAKALALKVASIVSRDALTSNRAFQTAGKVFNAGDNFVNKYPIMKRLAPTASMSAAKAITSSGDNK